MKETRINLLAWHEYQQRVRCDESVVFLPLGWGEPHR